MIGGEYTIPGLNVVLAGLLILIGIVILQSKSKLAGESIVFEIMLTSISVVLISAGLIWLFLIAKGFVNPQVIGPLPVLWYVIAIGSVVAVVATIVLAFQAARESKT